jgi:hypothetical protein
MYIGTTFLSVMSAGYGTKQQISLGRFCYFCQKYVKALLTASPSKMQTRKRVLRSSPEWLYGSRRWIKLPFVSL